MASDRAIERGDGDGILDQRAGIGRAQLERRIAQGWADRPPDVARIRDHAGAHQRRHIGVEFLLRAEQVRHAGARQLVVGGEPIPFQSRASRLPERRGGRKGEEQRQIGQHSIHHVDALVRIGQLDVHVQPAQEVALTDHLQVVHDAVVALFIGLLRAAPGGGRMGAGGQDGKPMLGRHRGDGSAQSAQLGARIRHVVVRRGDHLDLRLQELGRDSAIRCSLGGLEEWLRHAAHDRLRLGVDQEIFLFDAELERTGRS